MTLTSSAASLKGCADTRVTTIPKGANVQEVGIKRVVGRCTNGTSIDSQGDSITQTSAPGTNFQLTSEDYERRLDVLNLGLSGRNGLRCGGAEQWVNSRLGLAALKRSLSLKSECCQEIRLLTGWFGMCVARG